MNPWRFRFAVAFGFVAVDPRFFLKKPLRSEFLAYFLRPGVQLRQAVTSKKKLLDFSNVAVAVGTLGE